MESKRIIGELRQAEALGGRILARAERVLLLGILAVGVLHLLWLWLPLESAFGLPSMIALSAALFFATRAVVLGVALHRIRRRALLLLDDLEETLPPHA
jgi:hypothetical protein